MKFKNKTIIVTGGARGIGASIVQYFFVESAVVYVIDKKNPTEFNMINNENLFLVTGDVTNNNDVELFISDVMSESSSVDVLVNNAGILRDNVIWKLEEEDLYIITNGFCRCHTYKFYNTNKSLYKIITKNNLRAFFFTIVMTLCFFYALIYISRPSTFLYFQF